MTKKDKTKQSPISRISKDRWLHLALRAVFVLVLPPVAFVVLFWGQIYPGVRVAGTSLEGKTPQEAVTPLSATDRPTEVFVDDYTIPTESINLQYDHNKSADRAYMVGRSGNPFWDIAHIVTGITRGHNLGLILTVDEAKLADHISTIAGGQSSEPVYPSAKIVDGKVVIDKGKKGEEVDQQKLRALIGEHLAYVKTDTIATPRTIIDPTLSPDEEEEFTKRAEKLMGKSLSFTFEYQNFTYKNNDLLAFLDPTKNWSDDAISRASASVASALNRSAQNPTFVFEGGRVKEFAPARDGVRVKTEDFKERLATSLDKLATTDDKVVTEAVPTEITKSEVQTSEVNNLGIKELIGRGTSRFRGSIASRVYNINLAASRINGTLIPPGETFSFNNSLGDVSQLTGYKQAYVIQDGKTVLGDGGGVCQVSTTLFRAVLNAGLPIVERRSHSYRVGYYEQDAGPGLDATVYSPTTDFKFKNDTGHHILIQAIADTKNLTLVFELYGTGDGRVAQVGKPVIISQTAPPPDQYVDDPTLPAGTIKQIEYKAWGAKTTFTYKVTRGTETLIDTSILSTYRPWAAVYLRGTGPR